MAANNIDEKTVRDFGEQWNYLTENTGYYGSSELLADIIEPLLLRRDIVGRRILEIGSGTGRIVNMLLDLGAGHVVAVEPSEAFDVLRSNTIRRTESVTLIHAKGDDFPVQEPFDVALSIGVIHHIQNPAPVVHRMYESLKPGGKIFLWVYGQEGNELYLAFAAPLREVTTRIPDSILGWLSHALTAILLLYIFLCKYMPLPMKNYMRNLLAHYNYRSLQLTVFDQLNPAYAKYYSKGDALALLIDAGFRDVSIHHRHGYSWAIAGVKPGD